MKKDKEFKFRFDSKQHEIDALTLVGTLINMSNIIQEINKELDNDRKIDIKIKALQKGSFLVDIELQQSLIAGVASLFSAEVATHIPTVIRTLVDLTNLHKFLKGNKGKEKTDDTGRFLIENNDGQIMVVNNHGTLNLYNNNPAIPQSFAKTFETLKNDPAVEGFEITDPDNNPLSVIDRDSFDDLSTYSSTQEEATTLVYDKALLSISKLSFDITSRTKWDFNYRGKPIKAAITDNGFIQNVKDGVQRFGSGDILEVDLEIQQVYDVNLDTFINKNYTIVKVHHHIPRPDQQKIF